MVSSLVFSLTIFRRYFGILMEMGVVVGLRLGKVIPLMIAMIKKIDKLIMTIKKQEINTHGNH